MMQTDQVAQIVKFFSFLYPQSDEVLRQSLQAKTRIELKLRHDPSLSFRQALVAEGERVFTRNRTGIINLIKEFGFSPESIGSSDLSFGKTWAEFIITAQPMIVLTMLYLIVGFTEEEIAVASNMSLGTVKYRVSKAVKQLGMIRINSKSNFPGAAP